MCLTIKGTAAPTIETAEEDLYVYKVLLGSMCSPYRHTRYFLGEVMTMGLTGELHPEFDTEGGSSGDRWYVNEGIHSFATLEGAQAEIADWGPDVPTLVFVAVIPKGSQFVRGEFNVGYGETESSITSTALMLLPLNHPESLKRLTVTPSLMAVIDGIAS